MSYASSASYKYAVAPDCYWNGPSDPPANSERQSPANPNERSNSEDSAAKVGIKALSARRTKTSAAAAQNGISVPREVELVKPTAKDSDFLANLDPRTVDAWTQKQMPLRVYFVPPKADLDGFNNNMFVIFRKSCDEWSSATNNKVSFAYTENVKEADITVRFVSDRDRRHIHGSESGNASVTSGFRGIDSAHIEMLTKDEHGLKYSPGTFKETCLHELGHALGISGHSPIQGDIMAPAFCSVDEKVPLTEIKLRPRDINTLLRIYNETDRLYIRRHQRGIAAQVHGTSEMSSWSIETPEELPQKKKHK
jgi:predicted Zn-dependent protease